MSAVSPPAGNENYDPTTAPTIAVYDGQLYAGAIVERRNGQVEAYLPSGDSIGLFTSTRAAARALLASWRGPLGDGRP
jgi:hypothetical protein